MWFDFSTHDIFWKIKRKIIKYCSSMYIYELLNKYFHASLFYESFYPRNLYLIFHNDFSRNWMMLQKLQRHCKRWSYPTDWWRHLLNLFRTDRFKAYDFSTSCSITRVTGINDKVAAYQLTLHLTNLRYIQEFECNRESKKKSDKKSLR